MSRRKLECLIVTASDLLTPFRKEASRTNIIMFHYEQDIANMGIKLKVRSARLELKNAIKEYNKIMQGII